METIDPTTGRPLPPDAIQRVLFVASSVHVYNIPPMSSAKGHMAADWTADGNGRQIFTARGRILETSYDDAPNPTTAPTDPPADARLKVDIVLEDPATGQLFAAAPYAEPTAVEAVLDSSRFFAITVRDPQGRRAMLGIGFEERSDAFDFSVALQEARRSLGWDAAGSGSGSDGAGSAAAAGAEGSGQAREAEKRDYSLKDGETITVNLGGTKFGRRAREKSDSLSGGIGAAAAAGPGTGPPGFSLAPPPGGGPLLPPPPPPAGGGRHIKRPSQTAQELGFDDGQFGEFA